MIAPQLTQTPGGVADRVRGGRIRGVEGFQEVPQRLQPTLFPDSGLPLDFPPADAIISLQCIGLAHPPLPPGKHTMTLDAVNTQALPPQYGGGFAEYHNTWDVTVERGK
jgi:hypothetical protein